MEKQTTAKKCRKVGPYLLLRQIGNGSYSQVFEAIADGVTYAVKQIKIENVKEKNLQRIRQEIEVLSVIKHPNIINLIDYKQTTRHIYLVFQHCKFTDLDSYIKKNNAGRLPEEQVRRILINLKNAFEVMRKHKVVHRDLKLKNILVTQDFEIKLGDFGFAKFQQQGYFTSMVGTYSTMAPEIFLGQKYNEKCDIWSFGIIAYEMLTGRNPFFHKPQLKRHQIKESYKKPLQLDEQISRGAQDLIRKMLVFDPKERMSFQQLFVHPWLKEKPGCLSEWLRGETLRQEVARSLLKSTKTPIEKQFILQNCQTILAYSLVEFIRNYIQNSITTWLNVARHLIDLAHYNGRLTFLALAVILENVDQSLKSERTVQLNGGPTITLPDYMRLRDLQSWPMSEYTKRLPGFVAKSRTTINQYLKTIERVVFTKEEGETPLWQLYLKQLKQELQKAKSQSSQSSSSMRMFLKVKSWTGPNFAVNISSNVLSDHALTILTRTVNLMFKFNEQCIKCSSIFKLAVVYDPSRLQLQLHQLQPLFLCESEQS